MLRRTCSHRAHDEPGWSNSRGHLTVGRVRVGTGAGQLGEFRSRAPSRAARRDHHIVRIYVAVSMLFA